MSLSAIAYISPCRKASLTLVRKMVHYMSAQTLAEMCGYTEDGVPKVFPPQLVELLASVFDNEVHSPRYPVSLACHECVVMVTFVAGG